MPIKFYDSPSRKYIYLGFVTVYIVILLIFSHVPVMVEPQRDTDSIYFSHRNFPYLIYSYYESNFNYQLEFSINDFERIEYDHTLIITINFAKGQLASYEIISFHSFTVPLDQDFISLPMDQIHQFIPSEADSLEILISDVPLDDDINELISGYIYFYYPNPIYITDYPGLIVMSMTAILLYPSFFERFRQESARKEMMRDIGRRTKSVQDPRLTLAGNGDERAEREIIRKTVTSDISKIQDNAVKDTDGGSRIA